MNNVVIVDNIFCFPAGVSSVSFWWQVGHLASSAAERRQGNRTNCHLCCYEASRWVSQYGLMIWWVLLLLCYFVSSVSTALPTVCLVSQKSGSGFIFVHMLLILCYFSILYFVEIISQYSKLQ